MKKYRTLSGKIVNVGDKVTTEKEFYIPEGVYYKKISVTLTEDNIPLLVKEHLLTEENIDEEDELIDKAYEKIIAKFSKTWGVLTPQNLDVLWGTYPWLSFTMICQAVAEVLDEKYKDHISKAEKIYTISPWSGVIIDVNKAKIKSYKYFPAFRSIEDAKLACKVLGHRLRRMFNDK